MKARDNPFSTDRVLRIRYKPQGWTWPELIDRLDRLNYQAAIVGPHGSGKTTLLEDLEPLLTERGFRISWLRLTEDRRTLVRDILRPFRTNLTARDIILFDGAEQLGWWTWRRFLAATRNARGVIITTHVAGRLPTLIETRTTPALLSEIVAELLGARAAKFHGTVPSLHRAHRGNLRDALRELYDRFAAADVQEEEDYRDKSPAIVSA